MQSEVYTYPCRYLIEYLRHAEPTAKHLDTTRNARKGFSFQAQPHQIYSQPLDHVD